MLNSKAASTTHAAVVRDMILLVVLGAGFGLAYNATGLRSQPAWGLDWIAVDRTDELAGMDEITIGDGGVSGPPPRALGDDPMGVVMPVDASLPPIPDVDSPRKVSLKAVRAYVEADAALVIDAREPDEYADGHIPGSVNLPFDVAITDPVALEQLDTGGRPIIVYCGGGGCEVSINLAWELLNVGHRRVVVYEGGFPEWEIAGYPIVKGGEGD